MVAPRYREMAPASSAAQAVRTLSLLGPTIFEGAASAMIRRYLYGWFVWARAIRMARTKRHGAGPMKWRYAFRMAASYRWIVDGQMRGGKPPHWQRKTRVPTKNPTA